MFRLTQRLTSSKASLLSKIEARIKISIYSIFHELLQCQFNSVYLLNALLIVEAGQFLWYGIHPNFTFLWQTTLSQYPRDAIKYFQVDFLLRTSGKSFFYGCLYAAFSLQVVALIGILIVIAKLEESKRKSSTIVYYILQLLSLYAFLLTNVGPIPLFHIFFQAIICRDGDMLRESDECYTGIHLVNMIFGVFGLLLLSFYTILVQIFYVDFNPSSEIPFAAPQSRISLYKLALKIGFPLYITIDQDFGAAREFTVFFMIIWFVGLVIRYNSQGYYNNLVTIFATVTECLVFWSAATAFFQAYIDTDEVDDVGLYYFLFAAPFVSYTYFIIFSHRKWRILRGNIKKFQKAYQIEEYVHVARQLVEQIENPQEKIELEGLLRYHAGTCRKHPGECLCHELAYNVAKDDEDDDDHKIWYRFLQGIIMDGLLAFPKSSSLHLVHAYLQQEKLGNKYKALYELMIAEENRPSFQEQFLMFRYRNIIEKEMKEHDMRNTDSRGIDVNSIVHFQETFRILQSEIGKAVNLQLDYWRDLEQTNPSVQKLLYLGSKITLQGDAVREAYKNAYAVNPNNIRMLKMYGNFLKDIMNDSFEAQRVLEKAEYAERAVNLDKNFAENDRLKYSENSNTCIITCSANIHSMGRVLHANQETLSILQYPHTELIGLNISHVIPEVLGNIHDDLMKRYFETNESHVMGRERAIFPLTKSGYILPCALMIKIYPNLDEGIRIVGFLRKIEHTFMNRSKADQDPVQLNTKAHYILYGGENDTIYGVTESCYKSFGIPANLVLQNLSELTIDSIFPGLDSQNPDELRSQTGIVCTIDTTTLPENFLFTRTEESDEEEDNKRFKKAQVRAAIVEDSIFLNKLHIKVLKFIETAEENKHNKMDIMDDHNNGMQKSSANNGGIGSQGTDIDASRSEASNISVGSSMGDDIRQLKDMKAKISEKNIPSSIASIRLVSLVLVALVIVITSLQLERKGKLGENLEVGLKSASVGFERLSSLSDVLLNTRQLMLLADSMIITPDIPTVRTELGEAIQSFLELHFQVLQIRIDQRKKVTNLPSQNLAAHYLLNDGSYILEYFNGNFVYYDFIQFAQRLNAIDTNLFHQTGEVTDAEKFFYFIQRTGLNQLRPNAEFIASSFVNYYNDETDSLSLFHLITLILGIVFLAIPQLFIIPKIFSVNKTNMKVLSLFGYIPPEEVEELAEKCEEYIEVYLDEITARREYSYIEDEEEMQELTQQADANLKQQLKRRLSSVGELHEESGQSGQMNFTMQMKEFPDKHENSQLHPKSPTSQLSVPDPSFNMESSKKEEKILRHIKSDREDYKAKEKEEKEEREEDEEYQYYLHERSKKLRLSKVHNKSRVVIKIVSFLMIFVGYFVGDYLHEMSFISSYKDGISHLIVIAQRIPVVKFIKLYAMTEIAEDDLAIVYPQLSPEDRISNNYRIRYQNHLYALQAEVRNAITMDFPGAFDAYFDKLLSYSNGDLCELYYGDSDPLLQLQCAGLANGKLTRGLVQTESSLVQNADTVLSQFYATSPRDTTTRTTFLQNQLIVEMRDITNIITPILESLVDEFLLAFNDYFKQMEIWQQAKFGCFCVVLIILGLFVWLPYLRGLTSQIFRTKGLLNMIPMSMLKKNKALKEAFISNEVLNALK